MLRTSRFHLIPLSFYLPSRNNYCACIVLLVADSSSWSGWPNNILILSCWDCMKGRKRAHFSLQLRPKSLEQRSFMTLSSFQSTRIAENVAIPIGSPYSRLHNYSERVEFRGSKFGKRCRGEGFGWKGPQRDWLQLSPAIGSGWKFWGFPISAPRFVSRGWANVGWEKEEKEKEPHSHYYHTSNSDQQRMPLPVGEEGRSGRGRSTKGL